MTLPLKVADMSPEQMSAMLEFIGRAGPIASFPWHNQQLAALEAATNTVIVLGGNQSGKTTAGAGIMANLVRRQGPIYRRLRNPDRPLKLWIAPQSFEKVESNWLPVLNEMVFGGMESKYSIDSSFKGRPVPVFTWEDDHGGGTLWCKTQDQGYLKFESDVVDCVLFDEEPDDPRLYTSSIRGTATTNGVVVFTFTPLRGMSWSHGRFYKPTVKDMYRVGDRHWRNKNLVTVVQMGMADNPAAVAGGGVARYRDDPGITDSEKNTRLYGMYGFSEGLIFPAWAGLQADDEDSPWLIDSLPDREFSWIFTADPNKRHGGLLTAIDYEGNRYYVDEHYAENIPDSQHAAAYKRLWNRHKVPPSLEVFSDPGGAGAQAIINLAEHGIYAAAVPKDAGSVKASIELMRRALWVDPKHKHPITGEQGAPHCYFLRTLHSDWTSDGVDYSESRLMWEIRQYRQKKSLAPDTPVKESDDLVDCARYVELVRPYQPEQPGEDEKSVARKGLDALSKREAEDYDKVVARAMAQAKPKERRLVDYFREDQ